MAAHARPIRLFYSYAAQDETLRDQLERHLSLLQRQGLIEQWHDRRIGPGLPRTQELDQQLERADVILLLMSADFLACDACYEQAVGPALHRHQAGSARVILVLLRPAVWEGAPFSDLPCLPHNRVPVTRWTDPDEAWADVASGIGQVLHSLGAAPAGPSSRRAWLLGAAGGLLLLGGASGLVMFARRPGPRLGHAGRERTAPGEGVTLSAGSCAPASKAPAPPGVAIASVSRPAGPGPRFQVTAKNSTTEPAIIDHLLIEVEDCVPDRGLGESRLLAPLVSYDLRTVCRPGCYRYPLPAPILLASGDVVLIQVRLSAAGEVRPLDPFARGHYVLRLGAVINGIDGLWPERFDSWGRGTVLQQ